MRNAQIVIYGLACLLLNLWGCDDNSAPKTVGESELAKQLRRVEQLQQWGFGEAAANWYAKLSQPSLPRKIRYRALQKWLDLLKQQGKITQSIVVKQKILRHFPKQSNKLRQELLQHYLTNWKWQQARAIIQQILQQNNDQERLRRYLRWLKKWQQRQLAWHEDFDTPLQWALGHPTYYRRDPAKHLLAVTSILGSWYHAGQPYYWDGTSIILRFDIQIKEMAWCGKISCGLFSDDGKHKLTITFSCAGGSGDLHYHIAFRGIARRAAFRKSNTPINYQISTWYQVEIDYRQQIRQARLRLYKRQNKELQGECIIEFPVPLAASNYFIGIDKNAKGERTPSSFARAVLDNFCLFGDGWQKFQGQPKFFALYAINSLVVNAPRQAIAEYNKLIERYPTYWYAIEMRCYLWNYLQQPQERDADIRQLLRMQPQHPNRDFFYKLLQK